MNTIVALQTVRASQWWKHLRPFCNRVFWKRQRQADKRLADATPEVPPVNDHCTDDGLGPYRDY